MKWKPYYICIIIVLVGMAVLVTVMPISKWNILQPKSASQNTITKETYIGIFEEAFGSYDDLNIDCAETSNDGKYAKLRCNLQYKSSAGAEIKESSEFNMIKENGVWRLDLELGSNNRPIQQLRVVDTQEEKEKIEAEKNRINSIIETNIIKSYDEFKKITWYQYKTSINDLNRNGIILYFSKHDNKQTPSNLRIKINYYGNTWLFIEKYGFSIDGESFEYTPDDVDREVKSGSKIYEWSDEQVNSRNCIIIKDVINSESAKMRFYGDIHQDTETINPMQKYAMRTVLSVYDGLGGLLPSCLQNVDFGGIDINRKECISNEDCTLSDTRCINNRCGQCFTDNDCVEWGWHYTDKNGNKIDLAYCMNNECVECKSDSNCGNKEACYNKRCIEAECKTDADCSGDEPFCDTSVGWYYNCVECLKDSDCSSDEHCTVGLCFRNFR